MKIEKFLDRWGKRRAKGKWRYILLRGVGLWGSLSMAVWTLWATYFAAGLIAQNPDQREQVLVHFRQMIAWFIPLAVMAGILMGWSLWVRNERKWAFFNLAEADDHIDPWGGK